MAWRRFIVFDLDGTLIDSAPDIADAVNALLAELGKPALALAAVKGMIGDGAPVFLARALAASDIGTPAADLMPRFKTFYEAASTRRTTLYPMVREALEELHRAGRHLALCTNKPSAATRLVLDHFGLSPLFRCVIGGDSIPQRKPEKEPLLAAIAGSGGDPAAAPAEAVMVGDSHTDLLTAKAGNVPAVIIPSGYGRHAELSDGPFHQIGRFADLPATLRQLDQN